MTVLATPASVGMPVRGAVSYHVVFVRNDKQFHAAETTDPWLRVPDVLRFRPGSYRWSVQPAIAGARGIEIGEAVVVRTFRVAGG